MTLDDLQHPDCRACEERKRLSLGQLAEIAALKKKLDGDGVDQPTDDLAVELRNQLGLLVRAAAPIESGEGGEEDRETFSEAFQDACFLLARIQVEEEDEERDDH